MASGDLLAAELRAQRRRMFLTQRQLGEMLGRRLNTVSQWERGVRSPSLGSMARLAAIYPVEAMDRLMAATQ